MTTTDLDLNADVIDVRDIIDRVEELREEKQNLQDALDEAIEGHSVPVEDQTLRTHDAVITAREALTEWDSTEDADELRALEGVLENLAGNGGDEQWEGVWYPVTLIADSYFNEAMDELLEDIGELPQDLPCYLRIEVDYKALQMDYTSTEIEGNTYWYR